MPTIETLRELADLAAALARLPDDANVGWATAALLINVEEPPSQRTLERWRQGRNKLAESGPPYIPGPGLTSPVAYNVGVVRAWVRDRLAATTMDASVRRGLTFSTVADLSRLEPWVVDSGYVLGHALTVSSDEFKRALGEDASVELRIAGLADVMTDTKWADPTMCRIFHSAYTMVLQAAVESADGVIDATDLHDAMPEALERAASACSKCGDSHPGHACRV